MQQQMETTFQQDFTYTLSAEENFPPTTHIQASKVIYASFFQALRELSEAVLGFTVVGILSMYMPMNWLSSHLIFCAFFLIVFASSIRYRRTVAYSAGVVAAGGYSLLLCLHPTLHTQSDLTHLFIEPFLLFISSVLMSELLLVQRLRFIKAQEQYEQTSTILQETLYNHQKALTINAELERQIAGQTASVTTISDKIAQLWQPTSSHTTIINLMKHALGTDSCALYVQDNGQMHLSAGQPRSMLDHMTTLQLDNPVIRRVMQQCRVITVRDVLAEEKSGSQALPVMAGPLIDPEGKVVGIVVIDAMPLLKFTPGVVQLFSSLLRIASLAMQMTQPKQKNKLKQIVLLSR